MSCRSACTHTIREQERKRKRELSRIDRIDPHSDSCASSVNQVLCYIYIHPTYTRILADVLCQIDRAKVALLPAETEWFTSCCHHRCRRHCFLVGGASASFSGLVAARAISVCEDQAKHIAGGMPQGEAQARAHTRHVKPGNFKTHALRVLPRCSGHETEEVFNRQTEPESNQNQTCGVCGRGAAPVPLSFCIISALRTMPLPYELSAYRSLWCASRSPRGRRARSRV